MTAESPPGTMAPSVGENGHKYHYDSEYARMEAWLDEHPDFVYDYYLRKATCQMVDAWLVSHAVPQPVITSGVGLSELPGNNNNNTPILSHNITLNPANAGATASVPSAPGSSRGGSGNATPVRKISAHEFERGGLVKPMVTTIDGTPTFLSPPSGMAYSEGGMLLKTQRKSRSELEALDERELIFELVKDIFNDLDVRSLGHKILQNVGILTNADRSSLFLVQGSEGPRETRFLVSTLFDVSSQSTVEDMESRDEIRVAWGRGIVGYVAESGESVNIPDAYRDPRFNRSVDVATGYRTRSLLCLPIKEACAGGEGERIMGVAQVINKRDAPCFSTHDERIFARYLQFCGIGLRNAQLYHRSRLEVKRNQVLLDLARMIFEDQSTIERVVYRILTHTLSLIQCQRAQVLLVQEASKGTFSRVFDLEAKDMEDEEDGKERTSPFEGRFPINVGITGHVATIGETVNIPDAYQDDRFDPRADEGTPFTHRSVLCMPIKNAGGRTVGVIQLVNKFEDLRFTTNDENFVEAFAIFCGMGIHNTRVYETAVTAVAKQRVTLEVLSYHATASGEEARKLASEKVPSSQYYRLHEFDFDDCDMDDEGTLKACLRMFLDLDLVKRFHIDYEVLCRWLLSVKKNYRNVTYHNWRHAFNVAQMMFSIITATQWWKVLGELECLALLIACLCHDLDHRGTNNSFQIKASSALAQLYSTSTMEHHHFDQCLMILNSQGNQILAGVSSDEYSRVVKVLEEAILATDLALYFRNRGVFLHLVSSGTRNWWEEDHRRLLRGMLMTVCDLAAITKPWEVERRVAELVAGEFFEQGDIEREELNIQPIDMMDRGKKDQLPSMQVAFIDAICLPIYEAFSQLSDTLDPLLEGVKDNRSRWQSMAEENPDSIEVG